MSEQVSQEPSVLASDYDHQDGQEHVHASPLGEITRAGVRFNGDPLGQKVDDPHYNTDSGKYEEVSYPRSDEWFIDSNLKIESIAGYDDGYYIWNLQITYTNGEQSPLLGYQDLPPNTSIAFPQSVKIVKLKALFDQRESQGAPLYKLAQFELIDEQGDAIGRCGRNEWGFDHQ